MRVITVGSTFASGSPGTTSLTEKPHPGCDNDAMRGRCVAGTGTTVAIVVLIVTGSAAAGRLPAPVTLKGIAGVRPEDSLAHMRKAWGLPLPVRLVRGGSGADGELAIRAGRMRATAWFGSDSPVAPPTDIHLHGICFTAGATTDKGVGIGSTLGALRRAYETRLQKRRYPGDPDYRVVANTSPPRIAIGFVLSGRRVTKLVLAMASNLVRCD